MVKIKKKVQKNIEEEYEQWIGNEFKERTIRLKNPMNKFISNNINLEYCSSIARDYTANYLKNYVWINSMDTIITAFKLRDVNMYNKNPIIYGFLYSNIKNLNIDDKSLSKTPKKLKIVHTYFCIGPSLLSQDGEFRQRIILYSSLNN